MFKIEAVVVAQWYMRATIREMAVGSILAHGNEIFNILIPLLWKMRNVNFRHSTHNAYESDRKRGMECLHVLINEIMNYYRLSFMHFPHAPF